MTAKQVKKENNYFKLVETAKGLNIKTTGVKKEALREAILATFETKANEPKAKKIVVVEIEQVHIDAIAGLTTKKEKVIKLVTEFGYPVAIVAALPGINCHPTNAHAILRAAGLSTSTRTQTAETKEKIRATVLAKIAAIETAPEAIAATTEATEPANEA